MKIPRKAKIYIVASAIGLAILAPLALEIATRSAKIPSNLSAAAPGTTTFLDAEGGILDEEGSDAARSQVPLTGGAFGPWLPEITILLEDHRFWSHHGIDWRGTAGAAWNNLRNKPTRGASTITQQLAKLSASHKDRSWSNKLTEAAIARRLEREWSKQRILQAYLNRLDYGNRRLGPESAARAYFGKTCESLSQSEAIFLAGLPQSPTRFNPWSAPESARDKYRRSLTRLRELGYLSDQQAKDMADNPPNPERHQLSERHSSYVEAAKRDLPTVDGQVKLALHPGIQTAAESLLRGHLGGLNRHDVRNSALVVLENATGRVLALASETTPSAREESHVNAALVPRHAGSTLKPFVYQQALEERKISAATILADTAESIAQIYGDYDPKNFNQRYHGPIRARMALANSLNIPTILVAQKVGSRRAFERLSAWGLRPAEKFERYGAGFVLGNLPVRLLDLALAYSNLARHGVAAERVSWLADELPAFRPIASPQAAAVVEDILCDNAARALAFGSNSSLDLGELRRTAVKTGTSSSFRDAWIAGYNQDFTVAVWIGNLNGSSMNSALSVDIAGPVWRQMMLELYARHGARPLEPLHESNLLTRREVCSLSGLIPCEESPGRVMEWFLAGTEPSESAARFFQEGKIALPKEYAAWVKSEHNHLQAVLADEPPSSTSPFRVLSPTPAGRYQIDPALPAEQQKLALRTDHPHSERIVWEIGDEVLNGQAPMWNLRAGKWKLTACDQGTGEKLTVHFTVEGL